MCRDHRYDEAGIISKIVPQSSLFSIPETMRWTNELCVCPILECSEKFRLAVTDDFLVAHSVILRGRVRAAVRFNEAVERRDMLDGAHSHSLSPKSRKICNRFQLMCDVGPRSGPPGFWKVKPTRMLLH